MKVRVFYRTDGGISVMNGVEKSKKKNETDKEFYDRQVLSPKLAGAEFEDVEKSDLPVYASATRNKWRGSKGQGVHIDATVITRVEKKQQILDDIDVELDKQNPNSINVLKLQRKLAKNDY